MQPETGPPPAELALRLRGARDRYAAFAFCLADLLLEVDPELHVLFAAGASEAMLGQPAEALAGRRLDSLFVDVGEDELDRWRRDLAQPGRHVLGTRSLKACDGRVRTVAVSALSLDAPAELIRVAIRRLPHGAADGAAAHTIPVRGELSRFASCAAGHLHARANTGLSVLSIDDVEQLGERLPTADRAAMFTEIHDQLRRHSLDGASAVALGRGRYGVLHDDDVSIEMLQAAIEAVIRRSDPAGTGARVQGEHLPGERVRDVSESDLANGVICTLNRLRDARSDGLSMAALLGNLGHFMRDAVTQISDFRKTIAGRQYQIVFQPIVALATGRIHHYEALFRFEAAALETSPAERIAFAEDAGLIDELDIAVVQSVVGWLSHKPVNSDRHRVAVNVSGRSLGSERYRAELRRLLAKYPWTRDRLLFEITESAKLRDIESGNAFIQELRGLGYEVCLDDFGSGAASFQYLSRLDVDIVKFDGSAVQKALTSEKGRAFLGALTELCRRLGTRTIAEHIDSREALRMAQSCRVDMVQGYLFGRPDTDVGRFAPLPNGQLFGNGAHR